MENQYGFIDKTVTLKVINQTKVSIKKILKYRQPNKLFLVV